MRLLEFVNRKKNSNFFFENKKTSDTAGCCLTDTWKNFKMKTLNTKLEGT